MKTPQDILIQLWEDGRRNHARNLSVKQAHDDLYKAMLAVVGGNPCDFRCTAAEALSGEHLLSCEFSSIRKKQCQDLAILFRRES